MGGCPKLLKNNLLLYNKEIKATVDYEKRSDDAILRMELT